MARTIIVSSSLASLNGIFTSARIMIKKIPKDEEIICNRNIS